MNHLFRILASCVLALVLALGGVVSPALAQSLVQVQVIKNLPTILSKGLQYYIAQTSEGSTIVQFQNKSIDKEAKVAFLYKSDGSQIVTIPPNDPRAVNETFQFGGSTVIVQNISNLDAKVSFLVIAQGSSNGQTQTQVGDNFNIATDVDTPVDQILGLVKYSQKFVIQVVNKTPNTLSRVGAYNNSSNWPIGNIGSLRAVGEQFSGASLSNSFSFASNYEIGNTGKFVQFSASWPYIGVRKINLGVINDSGNSPAKIAWDKMDDPNDKSATNGPFSVKAFMTQKDGSVIWSYEVK